MIVRLSSSRARTALVAIALLAAAALAFASLRAARATEQRELGTLAGLTRAAQLEPSNPRNWYLLGRRWQYDFEEPDLGKAAEAYQRALALNPRSAAVGMDLGDTLEAQGDIAKAREAFLEARGAYPASAEVAWRYGNFLLRRNEIAPAFAEIRMAVRSDPQLGGEAFSRCWRAEPDADRVLNEVLPPSTDIYFAAIRDLAAVRDFEDALLVWKRLVALGETIDLRHAIPLTEALMESSRGADAHAVWQQAVAIMKNPPPPDPPGSAIWDGSFESGVTGQGFAWHFPPEKFGVKAAIDERIGRTGRRSLRLVFDGKQNLAYRDACTWASVQPRTVYHFSAWIRAQALTTDEGVRFQFWQRENPSDPLPDTRDVHGSQPWTQVQSDWRSGPSPGLVSVCAGRVPSRPPDETVSGTAWIDDVSLTPAQVPATQSRAGQVAAPGVPAGQIHTGQAGAKQ
jgi:hypothetical protein